jgi:hypothetical protein
MTRSKGLRMTVFLVTLSGAKGLGSSPAAQNDRRKFQNDEERRGSQ